MGSFTHAWYIFSILDFCLILSYPSAYKAAVLHFKNLECRTFNTSLQKWKCKCKYGLLGGGGGGLKNFGGKI